jgi:hypothetical protein
MYKYGQEVRSKILERFDINQSQYNWALLGNSKLW